MKPSVMKRIFFLIPGILVTFIIYAQENAENEITLEDLASPNAPAFTILGLNPTEVNKPSSAKPLILGLANAYDKGGLADNVAIEFSPFWVFPHPNLTFEKYYRNRLPDEKLFSGIVKNTGSTILQSSSISIATSIFENDIDTVDARNVSAGLRFQILAGKAPPAYDSVYVKYLTVSKLEQVFKDMQLQISAGMTAPVTTKEELKVRFKTMAESSISSWYKNDYITIEHLQTEVIRRGEEIIEACELPISNKAEADSAMNGISRDLLDEQEEQVKILRENEAINSRVGFIWEVAAASSLLLPTNELDYSIEDKYGIWSTFTYRTPNQKNDFNLMVRRMGFYGSTGSESWDIGLSYVLSRTKYHIHFEGILRYYNDITEDSETGLLSEDKGNTSRFSLSFEYAVTDFINLSATIAKDYEGPVKTSGNLFTLININFLLPEKTQIPF